MKLFRPAPPRVTLLTPAFAWVNSNSTAAGSITLHPVTTTWDEYTLKDNATRDLTLGEPKLSELPVESMNNFISIDVTNWVKAWLDGTLLNEGIAIEPSATTEFLDLFFDSKESDRTSHEARLEHFRKRYFQNGVATPHFDGLHLRGNDCPDLVREVLGGNNNDPAEAAAALLIVTYRLRNNLFHGVKWAYGIQDQRDNFEKANEALMSALAHE